MSSVMVYFASGTEVKESYLDLEYDKIYLVDNAFRPERINMENVALFMGRGRQRLVDITEKIVCMGMDCMQAVDIFIREGVKVNCFVGINEGLCEGGGSYTINSDFFIGYAMPILKEQYLHIFAPGYYHSFGEYCDVALDLPYEKKDITSENIIDLNVFKSSYTRSVDGVKVILMRQKITSFEPRGYKGAILLSVNRDSIWNHSNELDLLAISRIQHYRGGKTEIKELENTYERNLSHNKKVWFLPFEDRTNMREESLRRDYFQSVLCQCMANKIRRVGFYPVAWWNYENIMECVNNHRGKYPEEIMLFHLNKDEYLR